MRPPSESSSSSLVCLGGHALSSTEKLWYLRSVSAWGFRERTGRGDAAAATWIFRGGGSRRRGSGLRLAEMRFRRRRVRGRGLAPDDARARHAEVHQEGGRAFVELEPELLAVALRRRNLSPGDGRDLVGSRRRRAERDAAATPRTRRLERPPPRGPRAAASSSSLNTLSSNCPSRAAPPCSRACTTATVRPTIHVCSRRRCCSASGSSGIAIRASAQGLRTTNSAPA